MPSRSRRLKAKREWNPIVFALLIWVALTLTLVLTILVIRGMHI